MRHVFYALITTAGLALSLVILALAVDYTGFFALLGVSARNFVVFSLAAGWIGGVACWFLSRSIAVWSLGVKPLDGEYPAVRKVADAMGMANLPDVATYDSAECNAFVVGWRPSRSLLVLSSGLVAKLSPAEAEPIVMQRLVAVSRRDVSALILLNGILNVYTIYPARMLAFLFGTSLRTFTEETPSDTLERGLMASLEIFAAGFGSLAVRHFARDVERRADRETAKLLGKERLASAFDETERLIAPKTHREVFIFPLKFAVSQSPRTRWFGYHLPLSERRRP